jgi:hypothetical protein
MARSGLRMMPTFPMNEGQRRKKKLWSEQGRAQLEKLPPDSTLQLGFFVRGPNLHFRTVCKSAWKCSCQIARSEHFVFTVHKANGWRAAGVQAERWVAP